MTYIAESCIETKPSDGASPRTFMHVCMYVYVFRHLQTYAYIEICKYMHGHRYIYIYTHIHVCIYICFYTHTYTYTYTYTYIYTYIHIYMYVCICTLGDAFRNGSRGDLRGALVKLDSLTDAHRLRVQARLVRLALLRDLALWTFC